MAEAAAGAFREQADGDLLKDGVCGVLIAEKLGIHQPTLSEHMKLLVQSGLIRSKRIRQWTFYQRDEERIEAIKTRFAKNIYVIQYVISQTEGR